MDFDPLSLFTPRLEPVDSREISLVLNPTPSISNANSEEKFVQDELENVADSEDLHPFHILDLPILQLSVPELVIVLFLKLLAPAEIQNFQAQETHTDVAPLDIVPEQIFADKAISQSEIHRCMPWISLFCPRFSTERKLACLPILAPSFKRSNETQFNAWLTRVISNPSFGEETLHLASLRMAENCGRTAQPEIMRKIVIDGLQKHCTMDLILLKEPSLTSDNLGLKTWGSALVLAERLVNHHQSLLRAPVLELGAGTGLAGIISAALGYETIMTDLPEIVPNLEQNVELNGIDAEVDELDWREPLKFCDKHGSSRYNTVILSDPIYLSQHPYWVVQMAQLFLMKSSDSRLLIQIPLRPKFEAERALLWRLLDTEFEVLSEEVLDGADDFGESQFIFKVLTWRKKN